MSYFPTIEDDLARAQELLAKGQTPVEGAPLIDYVEPHVGGTIYGADLYTAYKLLESFVAWITPRLELEPSAYYEQQIDALKTAERRRSEEQRTQLALLTTIREMADQATGIDRTRGDERSPGAIGAVKALIARYEALKAPATATVGTWPETCQARAFVAGAAWWEFTSTGGTMWASDRDKAEAEALRRYPVPPAEPK